MKYKKCLLVFLAILFLVGQYVSAQSSSASVSANLQSGGKAGQDLVIRAIVTNTGTSATTYTINVAGYSGWASSVSIDQSTFTLSSGTSKDVRFTFKVKEDVSGEQTFNIEVLSGNEVVVVQPVQVTIESDNSPIGEHSTKVYVCENGEWDKKSGSYEKGESCPYDEYGCWCNDEDENFYVDKSGAVHCRKSSYSSVVNGVWCYVENSGAVNTNTENSITDTQINQDKKVLKSNWIYFTGVILIFILGGLFFLNYKKEKKPKTQKEKLIKENSFEEDKEISKIPEDVKEAINISGLRVKKGSKTILEDINFSVKRGDFVSLLGPSGSGKSTIIEILAGRKKQTSGNIKIFEKKLGTENINHLIGFVPQGNEVYMNQSVLQNLENSAIKWDIKNSKEKIEKVLDNVKLSERKNLVASKLSGGQLKLLSLAMELIREPELLILDEPTTGLDPITRNQIITILSNLSRDNKKTILITTHFMDDAEECDEVVIIDNKKVVAKGTPEKLKKMLPGSGKMITLVLDNSDKDLLEKIRKTQGIEKIIAEGRTLNILMENPNAVEIANEIHKYGGYVNESKIAKATMKEVFVFFTGRKPEE